MKLSTQRRPKSSRNTWPITTFGYSTLRFYMTWWRHSPIIKVKCFRVNDVTDLKSPSPHVDIFEFKLHISSQSRNRGFLSYSSPTFSWTFTTFKFFVMLSLTARRVAQAGVIGLRQFGTKGQTKNQTFQAIKVSYEIFGFCVCTKFVKIGLP